MKGGRAVHIAGIVAEFDPFHTGHAYLIERARAALGGDSGVVVVMSGNWTQRADCAIADKWTRAKLALMGGTDLVLELPTVWAVSSAERFARGGVAILSAAGVVDALSFGSECGDIGALRDAAGCLESGEYRTALGEITDKEISFAARRQRAVSKLLGEERAELLAGPNNNLGIEYLRALNALGSKITPITVRREGSGHNQVVTVFANAPDEASARRAFWKRNPYLSATDLRLRLTEGDWELAEHYLPEGGREALEGNLIAPPALDRVERAMLARVRTMTAADWAKLPDSGEAEGLPQRLERAGRTCTGIEEFLDLAKTKRYTRARLCRLTLWAYLGLTAADMPQTPPYLRVLGFNNRGREILREMKKRSALPILTKPAHARKLTEAGRRLFRLEARCTDLYGLCFETVPAPGREWTTGPVILDKE